MKHSLLKMAIAGVLAYPINALAQAWNFGVEAGYVNNTLAVEGDVAYKI